MKRSFALLEVTIGLALMMMLIGWLVSGPMRQGQKEARDLVEMEAERAWEAKLFDIKSELKGKVHSLGSREEAIPVTVTLDLGLPNRTYSQRYKYWLHGRKETVTGERLYLVGLDRVDASGRPLKKRKPGQGVRADQPPETLFLFREGGSSTHDKER